MAILNSIRKRGIFLIIIIALALFAFIVSDSLFKGGGNASVQNTVGNINGTEFNRSEFMTKVENYQRNLGPNGTTAQAIKAVWDQEVKNTLLKEQAEALGITVSKEQLNDNLQLSLANNPTFQDENGFYSESRMIEYVASIQNSPQAKESWNNYIKGISDNILQQNYLNMIKGGMVATLTDGEEQYRFENDKIDMDYVYIPYASVKDEEVAISETEISSYIKNHKEEYEVDPSVDIQYVTYTEEPSQADIEEVRLQTSNLIERFSATQDVEAFVNENSESNYTEDWMYKNTVPSSIKDTIFNLSIGNIYGPYKVDNTWNLSRLITTRSLPDSVKARHILIPIGLNKTDSVTRTQGQAKQTADSLYNIIKRNKSRFTEFVKSYSSDIGSVEKGGTYDYYPYNQMVTPFRDFTFQGKVGDLGVVESRFGYHIIEIEGQKNSQKVVKVATLTKSIDPSEETLGVVFSNAAKFEESVRNDDFTKISEQNNLTPKPINGIGELDATISGIGNGRTVINWAFEENSKVGDVKRFNIEDTYVIAQITSKRDEKGLMSVAEATSTVAPKLRDKKKAKKIRDGLSGNTLEEMASSKNVAVKNAKAITRSAPTIAGAGSEPLVVGAAFGKNVGETTNIVDGEKGVFIVRVTAINPAPDLANYTSFSSQLNTTSSSKVNTSVAAALKKAADIEDNRAEFY